MARHRVTRRAEEEGENSGGNDLQGESTTMPITRQMAHRMDEAAYSMSRRLEGDELS